MKKVLIALLAVLLLVSFTSCDTQKKIDDAVAEAEAKAAAKEKATLDFKVTFSFAKNFGSVLDKDYVGTYDLSKWNSTDSEDSEAKGKANDAISKMYSIWYSDSNNSASEYTTKSASGTIIIEEKDGKIVFTAKDVNISFLKNGNEKITYWIKLGGVISIKTEENTEEGYSTIVLTADELSRGVDTLEPIVATIKKYTDKTKGVFTSATCSGIELDCDIINNIISL